MEVGLVGLGFIGRIHVARYLDSEEADLVAVADSDMERLRSSTAECGTDQRLSPLQIPDGLATFTTLDETLQPWRLTWWISVSPPYGHMASEDRDLLVRSHRLQSSGPISMGCLGQYHTGRQQRCSGKNGARLNSRGGGACTRGQHTATAVY